MSGPRCCALLELRQYTLRPGRREDLVTLFERALLDPQQEAGMHVVGQFRDLDRPDRFVWLRGYPDLPTRARALTAFYDGPVWARHRAAANATMLDSSDARLLEPLHLGDGWPRPGDPAEADTAGPLEITVVPVGDAAIGTVAPRPGSLGLFVTAAVPNAFPRLPLRTDRVVVSVGRAGGGAPVVPPDLAAGPPTVLRLEPTPRSQLR